MSIKIGAAYIRASTDDQLEYSPDSQLKKIQEYAAREGYIIPEEYIYQDDGISGKKADKRPAFRLMIATVKDGKPPFDAVFVWEFSRFARNQEESIMYKNLLRRRGVAVKSVREPLNDSPFASLIERIIEWMDEYYSINLAIEVRRGMNEKASRGEAMGRAPFGYKNEGKTFVPDEHADVVRKIYRDYLDGKGARTIAAELGEFGIRTKRGKLPENRWVTYILQNPVYIGKIRWSSEGKANYSREDYRGENVKIIDGQHEPIIDVDVWNAVQEKMRAAAPEVKYVRKGSPRVYMLKGLLRCSTCGATLTCGGYTERSGWEVHCHNYAHGKCRTPNGIMERRADEAVIAALADLVNRKDFNFAAKEPKKKAPLRDWEKLIASEEAKLRRARDAMLEGALTPAEYKDVKALIEANVSKLRTGRDEEAQPEAPAIDLDAFAAKVSAALEVARDPSAAALAKNAALRTVIDKIVYNKAANTFDFYFINSL